MNEWLVSDWVRDEYKIYVMLWIIWVVYIDGFAEEDTWNRYDTLFLEVPVVSENQVTFLVCYDSD